MMFAIAAESGPLRSIEYRHSAGHCRHRLRFPWALDACCPVGVEIRRIEIVLAGDADQREQRIAARIGQRRSHPMRGCGVG